MKMLLQHVQTPPMPPSQRTELPIPRELDELVLACLEKDPNKRPQDAEELFEMACECRSCEGWNNDTAKTLVGNAPAGADRPADADRPATRGRRHAPSSFTDRGAPTDAGSPRGRYRDPTRRSWLDRALSLFTDVRAGEGTTAVLMLLNIFLLLICYSVIKIVREPLILLGGGAEVRSYAAAGQALVLMGFVPLYSWFASRVDRVKLLVGVTLFFVVNIELFALAVAARMPYVGRGVLHLGRHLQHLADRPVLVVRQRHLHQGGRRPPVPDHHDRHDGGRAARLVRRRPPVRLGFTPQVILQISAALLLGDARLLYLVVNARETRRAAAAAKRRWPPAEASSWCFAARTCA